MHVQLKALRIPNKKPRRRWEDNIKTNIKTNKMGAWAGLVWPNTGTAGRLL